MAYRCKLCGEIFESLEEAQMHLILHDSELLEEVDKIQVRKGMFAEGYDPTEFEDDNSDSNEFEDDPSDVMDSWFNFEA